MTVHTLKTWPTAFQAIVEGRKRFEYRKNDRNFGVGDRLELREWDPAKEWGGDHHDARYTGRVYWAVVLHILRGPAFDVPDGFCIMSICEVEPS